MPAKNTRQMAVFDSYFGFLKFIKTNNNNNNNNNNNKHYGLFLWTVLLRLQSDYKQTVLKN